MIKQHVLDLDPVDLFKPGLQLVGLLLFVQQFEQNQAVRRTKGGIGFMEPEPGLDPASILRQHLLNGRHVQDAFGDVNSQDSVFRFHRQSPLPMDHLAQRAQSSPTVNDFPSNQNVKITAPPTPARLWQAVKRNAATLLTITPLEVLLQSKKIYVRVQPVFERKKKGMGNECETELRPTLWRTCRALACETRLDLLRLLLIGNEISVREAASKVGVSPNHASTQLRALNARGLIRREPCGKFVFYRAQANPDLPVVRPILSAIRHSVEARQTNQWLMQRFTAFTHPRRIEIVRLLSGRSMRYVELRKETRCLDRSLCLHLEKLVRRGVAEASEGVYHLTPPRDVLSRTLLHAALR
jgi:DNA-binding transcriptional ArsR family regulator